nr:hypothetical protein [Microbacterium ulmi]
MTVRGPVPETTLGFVQPHEHIFLDISWVKSRWDLPLLHDIEQMTDEVRRFSAVGGGTLVDLTCMGIGRDPARLRAVSEAADVHIVMGTGWYRAPYYPPEIERSSTASLAALLVDDIAGGVDGVRPGIIGEIGMDKQWVQGIEERVMRAAARAQRATGLALTTHTPPSAALAMYEVFAEEGVDPARIVFGHLDNTLELDYLVAVAELGAYVQFDLIGIEDINSDARRADMIVQLIRRGHADRLLLSCDVGTRRRLATNGGHGYGHLTTGFLPMLRERGVAAEEIDRITQTNPQRMLAG